MVSIATVKLLEGNTEPKSLTVLAWRTLEPSPHRTLASCNSRHACWRRKKMGPAAAQRSPWSPGPYDTVMAIRLGDPQRRLPSDLCCFNVVRSMCCFMLLHLSSALIRCCETTPIEIVTLLYTWRETGSWNQDRDQFKSAWNRAKVCWNTSLYVVPSGYLT